MPRSLWRTFFVVFVPGAVAAAPWVFLAAWVIAVQNEMAWEYVAVGLAIFAGLAVLAGMAIDAALPYIETRFDRRREQEFEVQVNWIRYRSRTGDPMGVGFDQLEDMRNSMHFTMSMMLASPSFVLGVLAVLVASRGLDAWFLVLLLLPVAAATAWLFGRVSCDTHETMCRLRRELNEEVMKR